MHFQMTSDLDLVQYIDVNIYHIYQQRPRDNDIDARKKWRNRNSSR